MGLFKRYKTVRDAEKRKKNEADEDINLDELDEFSVDAGDHLEAEVLAELEESSKKRSKR